MKSGAKIKTTCILLLLTLCLGTVAYAASFNFHLTTTNIVGTSSTQTKTAGYTKARVSVTSITLDPGYSGNKNTNFLVAQIPGGAQVTEAAEIAGTTYRNYPYTYEGNNYSALTLSVALRGNYTGTGPGYTVKGYWYPSYSMN